MRRLLGRALSALGSALVVVVLTAILAEATLAAIRHVPFLYRLRPLKPLARELYYVDRGMVQLLPECARWDPDLGYTLRPGRCTFANTEFRTTLLVNRLGARDSEEALTAPEVVVLGDSFALGWGVSGDETFAARLGNMTGLRVLNTGVASYGTVRELRLLAKVDRSRLTTIVWQFCNNDYVENAAYAKNGNRLATLLEAEYDGWVSLHARDRRYVPGRYLLAALTARYRALTRAPLAVPPSPDPDDPAVRRNQVAYFLNALETSPVNLSPYRIVLFEMNARNEHAEWFLPMLREEIAHGGHPDWVRRLVLVDVAARLVPSDFYVLDDHPNPEGQKKVAEILFPYVRRGSSAAGPTP
jgi:lysophospholipase L1-like esterase